MAVRRGIGCEGREQEGHLWGVCMCACVVCAVALCVCCVYGMCVLCVFFCYMVCVWCVLCVLCMFLRLAHPQRWGGGQEGVRYWKVWWEISSNRLPFPKSPTWSTALLLLFDKAFACWLGIYFIGFCRPWAFLTLMGLRSLVERGLPHPGVWNWSHFGPFTIVKAGWELGLLQRKLELEALGKGRRRVGRQFVSKLDFLEGKPTLYPQAEFRLPRTSHSWQVSEEFYCLPFRNKETCSLGGTMRTPSSQGHREEARSPWAL